MQPVLLGTRGFYPATIIGADGQKLREINAAFLSNDVVCCFDNAAKPTGGCITVG
jgi:hypothetical protein